MKSGDNLGDPSYFSMPLSNCLCHVSFRRYLQLSVELLSCRKTEQMYSFFGPQFLGMDDPNYSMADFSAIYCALFGKSFCATGSWA